MQPVSMLMSNMNVEAMTNHAPNALAAAQDTGQSQEIVREGIRQVQRVQASEEAKASQRVHRKTENDEREGRRQSDEYHHTNTNAKTQEVKSEEDTPLLKIHAKTNRHVNFVG